MFQLKVIIVVDSATTADYAFYWTLNNRPLSSWVSGNALL